MILCSLDSRIVNGSVKQMKESNKQSYTGSRDDVIAMGYIPCKKCNP